MAKQSLWVNLGLTLATLAVVILGAEFLARRFNPDEQERLDATSGLHVDSEAMGHTQKSGFSGEYAGGFVTTNERGHRGRLFYGPRPNTRILMLGDSIAFGYGVDDDETFSHVLETDFPGYEVINFGVSGYHTGHNLIQLLGKGLHLKPDWVVLNVSLFSDAGEIAREDRDRYFDAEEIARVAAGLDNDIGDNDEYSPKSAWQRLKADAVFWLNKHSALFYLIHRTIDLLRNGANGPPVPTDEELERGTKRVVSLIEKMAKILRQNDIQFLVLLHHYLEDSPRWPGQQPSSNAERQFLEALTPTGIKVVAMSEEYAKRGIDISTADELYLYDGAHPSPRGHGLIARIIHDLIAEGTGPIGPVGSRTGPRTKQTP